MLYSFFSIQTANSLDHNLAQNDAYSPKQLVYNYAYYRHLQIWWMQENLYLNFKGKKQK